MKTSIDLPDELYRQVKSKSALEGRTVREVATTLFEGWVTSRTPSDLAAASGSDVEQVPTESPTVAYLQQLDALGAALEASGATGLVAQLKTDRR
ncbi:MAG: hypothetical protein WCK74_03240 [Gemmatimonadaceae bacterium]